MRLFLLLALGACRLPHVAPALRSSHDQRLALAAVTVSCTSPDPFAGNPDVPNDPTPEAFPIEWNVPHQATGVVISERHILTAAHAVMCGALPQVRATFANGRTLRMVVERDGDMFPSGEPSDVARLELASGGGIGLHVAPPVIRDARGGEECCARTLHGSLCGAIDPYRTDRLNAPGARDGDSGAPVFCDGALVGFEVKSPDVDPDHMHIQALTPASYWLEGT